MSAIAIALLLALGGAGIGHRLVPARTAAGLRLPLALALGFLVIGALTLALGLAGVLRSPLTPALLVLAAGFGLALGAARLSRPVFVRPSPAALAIAVIVTALLLLSLAPTTFYDSLLYHLGSPVAWLIEGRIAYEPGVFQTGLPCAAEVLYTPALRLGAMTAAQALNVLVGVALLLAVAGAAGGASAPPRASALAALTLAASPMFLMLAYLPKSDLLAALFGLLAMAVLWEDDGDEALAGFLAAAAATAKTTAAVVLAPTLAVLLLTRPKRPRRVGLALAGAALALDAHALHPDFSDDFESSWASASSDVSLTK